MNRGLGLLLICCVGWLVGLAWAAGPTPVDIGAGAERVALWQDVRIVTSADRNLAPFNAARLAAGSDAFSVDSPNRVLGRAMRPLWAAFSLSNPASSGQMRLLALEATTQHDTSLYERSASGAWRKLDSLADAAARRFASGSPYPVWAIQMEPHQTRELLLRIEGPAIVRMPLYVYQPIRYVESERKIHFLVGIALGSCLLICLYVGSLRRYINDRSVPLFICMLIADLVGGLWLSGVLSELFPMAAESLLSSIGFASYAILLGCGSLHARIYLNSAVWAPRTDLFLQLFAWLWLTMALWFPLVFPVAARIVIVWGGTLIAIVLVAVSVRAARRKIPLSGYIAAAWLAYFLVGSYFLIARVVDNPLLWSSNLAGLVQATVIALLFGFATSQRLIRQRDLLLSARQEAVMQREQTAAIMRERSLLFAATNHDLRQPLLGVSLYADLLKSAATPEQRATYTRKMDMALREVDDLLVCIQQLAAVHEIAHRPVFEIVRLDDLLAPLIEEYRSRSAYKRITIRYVPSRMSISTHAPYFQRIVRNLLSNAIRYTSPGGRILVGCRHAGGAGLVVMDTGRGMSEPEARLAFDAFQRFDAGVVFPEGFGLGLFSTRSLAQVLGLVVALQSHRGRGTAFRIDLTAQIAALPALK